MYLNPIFSGVPAQIREEFSKACEQRSFRRKEVVLTAGTPMETAVCVGTGLLRVEVQGTDGSIATTGFIRPHDLYMELTDTPFRYEAEVTLVATLPSSVYLVPLRRLAELSQRYPSVNRALLYLALRRLSALRAQFRRAVSSTPEGMVARALHHLTELAPSGDGGYDKRITQSVIASYTGLSREQVNKTMRELESRGLMRDEMGVFVPDSFARTAPAPLEDFQDTQPMVDNSKNPTLDLPPGFLDFQDDPPPKKSKG